MAAEEAASKREERAKDAGIVEAVEVWDELPCVLGLWM